MVTSGYNPGMLHVPIKDAKARLTELVRLAEAGERVVITRHGKPVADLGEHKPRRGGVDFEAGHRFMDERGIKRMFTYVAPDFDAPLPEDFLITPEAD